MNSSLMMILGLVLLLFGGGVLALVAGAVGTGLGTTIALAGILLIGWGWIQRSTTDDES